METRSGSESGTLSPDSARQDEIRAQVDKLLASAPFASSPRGAQLLRYLVERTLRGEGDRINEYAVGTDVFGKPASFDPRIESIVRTEMGRLRQKLKDANTEAAHQQILIEIPLRSYKPTFRLHDQPLPPVPKHPAEPPKKRRLTSPRILLFGLAAILVAIGFWIIHVRSASPQKSEFEPIRSLAVLPLQNLSNDPEQEYFADGMTDELITDLAQLHDLKVVSRTSSMPYKGSHTPLPRIGRELGVDVVIDGSVFRSGNRVRITARLIRAATSEHLWASAFEGDLRDALSLQSQAAEAITGAVKIALTSAERKRLRSPRPVDPQSYDAYLRGRYHLNRRDSKGFEQAIGYFNESLALNPNFALAYAGLSDCYTLLAFNGSTPGAAAKARAAAVKALSLDDGLAEPHTSLAGIDVWEWNWPDARREFQRALALNPNYALAHHWYGNLYLSPLGRHAEAIAELKRAQELDPLSLIVKTDLGFAYFFAAQPEAALSQYQKVLAADPSFAPVHWALEQYYFEREMYGEGAREMAQVLSHNGELDAARLVRSAFASGGRRKLLLFITTSRRADATPRFDFESVAKAYLQLGRKNLALKALEEDLRRHGPNLIRLQSDPSWNALRSDPEFSRIETRVGLRN